MTIRPKSLGDSAEEISFRLYNRLRGNSRLLAQRKFIPLISALQAGDTVAADKLRLEMATNAIADIADVYYSIFAVAFNRKVETAKSVTFIEVPEVPPMVDPERSWEYSLYRNQLRHHWNLIPYCGMIFKNISGGYNHPPTPQKPLMLRVDNEIKTYPIGLAQSKDYGHDYLIPVGVYEKFEVLVGPHAELSRDAEYHFVILLDDREAFRSKLMTKTSEAQKISLPLGKARKIKLQLHKTKGSRKHIHGVWADPRLIKPNSRSAE